MLAGRYVRLEHDYVDNLAATSRQSKARTVNLDISHALSVDGAGRLVSGSRLIALDYEGSTVTLTTGRLSSRLALTCVRIQACVLAAIG